MTILHDYIKNWYKQSNRQPEDDAGAIHPSWLGDCNRLTIYKYNGLPRDLKHNAYKRAIFFHGYRIEDWMNEALAEEGLLIAKSVPVKAEYRGILVEGTIDHIIKWEDGWCIADTKSVHDGAFNYKSFPYQNHVLQVGAYQWALVQMMEGRDWPPAILSALDVFEEWSNLLPPILFYVGRGNLKEEPPVSVGDHAIDWALEKLDVLVEHIETDTIPVRPFRTPEQHPYLCASCIRKGRKRKDGTYLLGSGPEYVPNCGYFKRCWGKMPGKWGIWREA